MSFDKWIKAEFPDDSEMYEGWNRAEMKLAWDAQAAIIIKLEAENDKLDGLNMALDLMDKTQATTIKELREALNDLLASISGGDKSCGHEFTCVCAGDKARAIARKGDE